MQYKVCIFFIVVGIKIANCLNKITFTLHRDETTFHFWWQVHLHIHYNLMFVVVVIVIVVDWLIFSDHIFDWVEGVDSVYHATGKYIFRCCVCTLLHLETQITFSFSIRLERPFVNRYQCDFTIVKRYFFLVHVKHDNNLPQTE